MDVDTQMTMQPSTPLLAAFTQTRRSDTSALENDWHFVLECGTIGVSKNAKRRSVSALAAVSQHFRGVSAMNDYKQLPLQFPPEIIEIPLSKTGTKYASQYTAIVDAVDSDLAELNWSVHNVRRPVYATRENRVSGTKKRIAFHMHRIILGRKLGRELTPDEIVDHVNGNGLDNRRENLRLATLSQNASNRSIASNNTSGYRGVSYHKGRGKYQAYISKDGKRRYLGLYDTPEEARDAFLTAANELFGDYIRHDG